MIKFPKSEKVTFQLRQDLADRLPKENPERRNFLNRAVEHELDGRKAAAAIMGSATSPRKAASSRENAKKPRPRNKENPS
ncbi:MAG: hypothetical protein LBK83_01315 [Treponema sp.]|jgi:hypothetical protein|nr:hypothetical protein [Treponema sp.]